MYSNWYSNWELINRFCSLISVSLDAFNIKSYHSKNTYISPIPSYSIRNSLFQAHSTEGKTSDIIVCAIINSVFKSLKVPVCKPMGIH